MSFNVTSIPEYVDTVIFQKEDFYKTNSNLLDIFDDYLNELKINIVYEKGKSSGNILSLNNNFFKKLNDDKFKINGVETGDTFKNYYIEKYNSLFKSIKTSVKDFIGESNVYFKNYSDDVGILTDSVCIIDNSISPYSDIFYTETDIPNNLNSTIFNKVSNDNILLQLKNTKFNDAILKNNLKGLVEYKKDEFLTNATAHGKNLVIDYNYLNRLFSYKEPMAQSINTMLKGLGDYILFVKNLNKRQNSSKASVINFSSKIENIDNNLDILKNKVSSNPYTDNSIL
jgi:hypothetical protein